MTWWHDDMMTWWHDEVWNYDLLTDSLTRVKSRDASASKNKLLSTDFKFFSSLAFFPFSFFAAKLVSLVLPVVWHCEARHCHADGGGYLPPSQNSPLLFASNCLPFSFTFWSAKMFAGKVLAPQSNRCRTSCLPIKNHLVETKKRAVVGLVELLQKRKLFF